MLGAGKDGFFCGSDSVFIANCTREMEIKCVARELRVVSVCD